MTPVLGKDESVEGYTAYGGKLVLQQYQSIKHSFIDISMLMSYFSSIGSVDFLYNQAEAILKAPRLL